MKSLLLGLTLATVVCRDCGGLSVEGRRNILYISNGAIPRLERDTSSIITQAPLRHESGDGNMWELADLHAVQAGIRYQTRNLRDQSERAKRRVDTVAAAMRRRRPRWGSTDTRRELPKLWSTTTAGRNRPIGRRSAAPRTVQRPNEVRRRSNGHYDAEGGPPQGSSQRLVKSRAGTSWSEAATSWSDGLAQLLRAYN